MTETSIPNVSSTKAVQPHIQDFIGQPKGLWILVLTEAAIAFGLYGMESILLPYIQHLLKGVQVPSSHNLPGADLLFSLVRNLYHPTSDAGLAAGVMGLFLSILYAIPLLGAFLADKWLGRTRSVIIGVGLVSIGIALLAQASSFVIALLLTLLGVGLTGSMKAQVGALYTTEDRRRSDAYQIYSLGIQAAVIVSPILCAWLATKNWSWAFLFASIGVFIGGLIYLIGQRNLPKDISAIQTKNISQPTKLTLKEYKQIGLITLLMILFAFGDLPNSEIFDGYLIWANHAYKLQVLGYNFPVSDLFSLDGLISSITALMALWFWQFYDRRKKPANDMTKIIIGTLIGASGPLVLAYASFMYPGEHAVNLWWGILFHSINDFGFAMSTALGLSLVSRIAPESIGTIMISFFNLHLCLSSILVGKLASLIETINPVTFWLLHTGLSITSLLGLIIISIAAKKSLSAQEV